MTEMSKVDLEDMTATELKGLHDYVIVYNLLQSAPFGMAKTSKLKKFVKKHGLNIDVRKCLRGLEREGFVESDRPFAPKNLELRWRVV